MATLFTATSCVTERGLARQFVDHAPEVNILLLPPPVLLKNYYPIHPDSIAPEAAVEFDLHEGQFLYQVADSLVVRYFMETLSSELSRFNVRVFTSQNIDSFLELDTNAHVFSVAQMQLMEYLDEKIDYALIDTMAYEAGTEITTLVFNTWFEYTEVNNPEQSMEVLYSMQHRSDYIDGRFRKNWITGDVRYEFRPYRLTIDDVYDLTWVAGVQNAQYIFDFLLNQYVRETFPRDKERFEYYQYDRVGQNVRRAYNERFYIYPSPREENIQEP